MSASPSPLEALPPPTTKLPSLRDLNFYNPNSINREGLLNSRIATLSRNVDAYSPSTTNDPSGSSESLQQGNTGMSSTNTYAAPLGIPTVARGLPPQPGMPNANVGSPRQANADITAEKEALSKIAAIIDNLKARQTGPSASFENNSQPRSTALGHNSLQQQQRAMSENKGAHFPFTMNGPFGSLGSLQQGHTGMNSPSNLPNTYPRPLDETHFEQSFKAQGQRGAVQMNQASPQMMQSVVAYAYVPMSELDQCGVPEKVIAFIEANRVSLQRTFAEQSRNFQNRLGQTNQIDAQRSGEKMEHLANLEGQPLGELIKMRSMKEDLEKSGQRSPAQMSRASSQLMQSIVAYAHVPTLELHQRGIPEKIIACVETNRVILQRIHAEQRSLQNQLRLTNQDDAQGSGDEMDHLVDRLANSLYLRSSGTQRVPAALPAILARQPFTQQQQIELNPTQGNSFPEDRQLQRPQGYLPQGLPMRPTMEQLENSRQYAQHLIREFNTAAIPTMPPFDVPVERRAEYQDLLDTVHAQCLQLEPRLAMYVVLFGKEDPIKKLVAIICTVAQQKSFAGTRFIIPLDVLQMMLEEIKEVTDKLAAIVLASRPQGRASHLLSEVGGEASAIADGPDR